MFWLKEEHAHVYKRGIIARVEGEFRLNSEGSTIDMLEIESSRDGILRKRLVEEGAEVPEGTVIAFIGSVEEPLPPFDLEQLLTEDLPGEPLLEYHNTTGPIFPNWVWWLLLLFFCALSMISLWDALYTPSAPRWILVLITLVPLWLTLRTLRLKREKESK